MKNEEVKNCRQLTQELPNRAYIQIRRGSYNLPIMNLLQNLLETCIELVVNSLQLYNMLGRSHCLYFYTENFLSSLISRSPLTFQIYSSKAVQGNTWTFNHILYILFTHPILIRLVIQIYIVSTCGIFQFFHLTHSSYTVHTATSIHLSRLRVLYPAA